MIPEYTRLLNENNLSDKKLRKHQAGSTYLAIAIHRVLKEQGYSKEESGKLIRKSVLGKAKTIGRGSDVCDFIFAGVVNYGIEETTDKRFYYGRYFYCDLSRVIFCRRDAWPYTHTLCGDPWYIADSLRDTVHAFSYQG